MKSMAKSLSDMVKKTVRTAGLSGALLLGGCGIPVTNVEDPFNTESKIEYSVLEDKNTRYVGECMKIWKGPFQHEYRAFGRGTLFNKKGEVIREGYWNDGKPVDQDPLGRK